MIGIRVRPADGVMWAFANVTDAITGAPTGVGSIYIINPDTGLLRARAVVQGVTFDGSTSVSVDFDPVLDLMRVITFQGQSVSINVGTAAGTLEAPIQGLGNAAAVAYSNRAVSAIKPTTTVLYRISNNNPPDDLATVITSSGAITKVGGIGFNLVDVQAFDIGGATNQNALAALRTTAAGAHTLYRINLSNGAATTFNATAALSLIGGTTGVPLVSIAIRP